MCFYANFFTTYPFGLYKSDPKRSAKIRKFIEMCHIRGTTCQGLSAPATRGSFFECGCLSTTATCHRLSPMRREEVFLNAVAYQQPQRVIGFRLCDEWKFVYKRLYSQPQRVRGFQKSAKADILFRMLLVNQHSKIGICFAYRQKLISVVLSELYFCLSDNVRYAP